MAKFGGRQPGAGRPKGALSKPRISDYLTKEQVDALVAKAYEMAAMGNEKMLAFVLDHQFGKAPQAITGPDGGAIQISGVDISIRK